MSHAIFIGRFRPFHNGHLSAITQAFEALELETMTILVGSSNRHRSVKNPFTFEEVSEMIRDSLPDELNSKVILAPLGDHAKDDVWQSEVRMLSGDIIPATHIVGYDKDESSYYLKLFPELKLYQPEPVMLYNKTISATDFRDLYFSEILMNHPTVALLPRGTIDFLERWSKTELFTDMKAEYDKSVEEIGKFLDYPYDGHLNIACADNVVTCAGHVLLGTRKHNPGKNCLALPGGHKSDSETFLAAALRELKEETCIKVPEKVLRGSLKGEKMFDDPKRSYPHARISMAYHYDIELNHDGSFPKVKPADDLVKVEWVALSDVRKLQHLLYDDHYQMIQYFTGI
ncbi:bifunctional NMN adenylyltransferase/ADP-ribose pyrophosphatase [Vibrio phage nt-1]|uniref:Bifunctional NMN adenylyltransferase/ADP-ribose pyrophosphatase n=1 Tax=Vibrio phage nt-1 TaxID=115992 RepID=R9TFG2_9CAUD|nr:cytidyltransferase [Vibrio phage nt-1]AGN30209.2 bifunctional NMN adenylyltransferase/ADP-ribose pyrophosphatase [Vibrio phage nt-1]